MSYFKINNNDYSMYINKLIVGTEHNYKSMTTAAGNTLVKYVNSKRVLEVGIIPLDKNTMIRLQNDISQFQVTISFLDPKSGVLVENIKCIIPNNLVEYYTIQANKTQFKALSLQIKEL